MLESRTYGEQFLWYFVAAHSRNVAQNYRADQSMQTWDFLSLSPLFNIYDKDSQQQNDSHHLAAMTALLGPPPPELFSASEKTKVYWDADGEYLWDVLFLRTDR